MTKEEMADTCWRIAEMCQDIGNRYIALAARYDDALKRINDLEAENEYLRREVNRG